MTKQKMLTSALLKDYAGEKAFWRGEAYFRSGAVRSLSIDGKMAGAYIFGTRRYSASLSFDERHGLESECDCPLGIDGVVCKHVVALGLAWLEKIMEQPEVVTAGSSSQMTLSDYLDTLPHQELKDWLLAAAKKDAELRQRLLLAMSIKSVSDLSDLRNIVRRATCVDYYLDGWEAQTHLGNLYMLADLLEEKIGCGDAGLVELIEEAIVRIDAEKDSIDDDNGEVYDVLDTFLRLHQRACECLQPDTIGLAERLFAYQINQYSEPFCQILPDYETALGTQGLQRYRELIGNRMESLSAQEPEAGQSSGLDGQHLRLVQAMESLARQSGNADEVVRVMRLNLSSAHSFCRLTEYLAEQQRFDEALACAKEGLARFSPRETFCLVEFCIEEYRRREDFDKVESLIWDDFMHAPSLHAYRKMMAVADSINRQDVLSARALQQFWALVAKEEATSKPRYAHSHPVRTTVVSIYLDQQDDEAAWQAFNGGEVAVELWGKIAALRAKTHPDEAIALYFRLLPHAVASGSRNANYEEAFTVVDAIRQLRFANGQSLAFQDELSRIRLEFKLKRNFMKLLARLP